MRVQLVTRVVQPYKDGGMSGLLGLRQWVPVGVPRLARCSASTSLPPFAPRPLRRFNATMEALTSVCVSPAHRSPCFTHSTVLTIPSPTTGCPLFLLYSRYLGLSGTGLLPLYLIVTSRNAGPGNRFRLRQRDAGSPVAHGRIGFVILRTGRSPPVALHPASRRRSYSRLQAVAQAWRGLAPL